ncbi:Periplasmic serine proteases (ClpP class) [Pyrobaculum oguniense TE7]|uniref:Periplasmic serine proteases (ClpP class) n=1 Tax=Pyrobaculum oguniense (strain DSM 13380 / JCM 10595 / TE7) TaxID=698757 RepID=H6QAM5_PYROT|nr:Periplasmic serine proteases (ClpP class) [Pyrobaculum oguniense TE7]
MVDRWVVAGLALALAVSAAALFVAYTHCPRGLPAAPPKPKIVLVPIDFVLDSSPVDGVIRDLVSLAQRKDVAGVVLVINSPGGTVSATEALYSALAGLNKTKYAVVSGLAASGAYYVAVAAEKIYATPSSWVGSIGVVAVMWPDEYFYDIPDYVYTTGPLKYYGKELTDYYNDIERVRMNFVQAVLRGRAGRIKVDPQVFETAAVFTAEDALRLGLVDAVGGVFDAVRDMAQRLGLKEYEVKFLRELGNATASPGAAFRVDLERLMNSTPVPIFYILPTAVQWRVTTNGASNATTPAPARPEKPYVLLDLAHNNMVPRSFIEVLRAELAQRGYVLVTASSEYQLTTLLSNATALVVVNPTAPFSRDAVRAVLNATARGVRVAYFYDLRASAIITVSGVSYVAPYSLYAVFDPLPMYYNMSGLRAVYNFTAGALNYTQNWQYVEAKPKGNWTLLRGVERLLLFSPSAVSTNAPHKLEVRGYVFGYGWGNYTVAAQAGNFTFIGAVRSFTPYFITLADNWRFFKNVVDWLVEPRPIERKQGPISAVIYTS